jgi:Flp pilus assembly protein TadD
VPAETAWLAVVLGVSAAVPAAERPSSAPAARQCVDRSGDEGVQACRQALALGLPAPRAATLRRVLATKLAGLGRWSEVVDVYRDAVGAQPADADAQARLGHALLHLLGRPAEAVAPLQEALRLRPDDAATHAELGLALTALGRTGEAVAAFEDAARLDPAYFESRPATQATFDAARRGQRWP